MTRAALVLLLAAGCGSSARYTLPSAAINTGLAVGASAAIRSAGGCYSPCSPGYTCNPRTGFCDQLAPICVGEDADPRCTPAVTVPLGTKQADVAREGSPTPVGVSPETGRAPPGPGERPTQ